MYMYIIHVPVKQIHVQQTVVGKADVHVDMLVILAKRTCMHSIIILCSY